jgi:hypothetical protein
VVKVKAQGCGEFPAGFWVVVTKSIFTRLAQHRLVKVEMPGEGGKQLFKGHSLSGQSALARAYGRAEGKAGKGKQSQLYFKDFLPAGKGKPNTGGKGAPKTGGGGRPRGGKKGGVAARGARKTKTELCST